MIHLGRTVGHCMSKPGFVQLAGLAFFVGLSAWAVGQQSGDNETPIGPKWWPSEWGPADQRGAANRATADKVLEANQLIKTGKVYSLGRVYEHGMPLPGKRHFSLTIPGSPTYPPSGKNQGVAFDEMFSGEIGQVGTQFDGLGHVGVRIGNDDFFYNGFKRSEFATAYGHAKLGVENVGPIFTRGILIDVAGLRKTKRLPIGFAIAPDDLEACLDAARLKIRTGDVVLIHTGHGDLWMKDNDAYGSGEPGISMAAAKWLSDRKVVLVGADTWAIEVVPPQDPERPFPVHQWNLVRNGIYHLENLDLSELAADRVYEFAFVFSPLRLKGATGSPGNPIAIK
jgi:kynurenine formamidase